MDDFLTSGISFKLIVVYILEQNSHSEKKRSVFMTKVYTMCIAIHLLQQLWPKAIKITKYIANYTLMKKHEWKMLYELIKKHFLNFTHLKIYECKVYSKINILLKK